MSGIWRKAWIDGQLADDSPRVLEHLTAVPHWADGLDTITCPVGKHPGKARFLVNSDRFVDIKRSGPVPIRLQTANSAQPGDEADITFKNWIVTGYYDAVAIKGVRPIVVELADPRFVFRNSAYAKQYNIRYPLGSRFEPDSLNEDAPWTWEDLLDDLWDAVPTGGLITSLVKNNLPGTEPENINVLGEPAWDAFCRLVHQQGLEIFYDPFAATITIDQVTGPLQLPTVEKKLAESGDIPSGLEQAYVPEKVKVFFAKRAEPEPGNNLPHEIEAGGGGGSGTAVAWSDLTAETDENGEVIEAARLQAHADQIANELTDRRTNNSKAQSIRYVGWTGVAPVPGTTDIRWMAQPFAHMEIMLRPTDPPIVQPVINQRGTSLIFKLVEDFSPREDLVPASKVCDVYGLDTEADPNPALVEETWSDESTVQRKIYYAGTSTITASAEEPKYLKADMDYGGNYWVSESGGGSGATIMGEITAVTTASGSGATAPYSGLKIATVTVITAPCDRPELIGESISVVDHSGCVLDLDSADLVGLNMWASEGVAISLADLETVTPCHWCADDRCCTEEGL